MLSDRKHWRIVIVVAVVLLIVSASTVLYIVKNPPLYVRAITYNLEEDRYRVVDGYRILEVVNEGLVGISIKEVLVNGYEKPERVELGVSRSLHMVDGSDDPDITYHDLNAFLIKPEPSLEERDKIQSQQQQSGKKEHIFHYGVRVYPIKPLETITIKYSYLGIPLSITRDVRIDP